MVAATPQHIASRVQTYLREDDVAGQYVRVLADQVRLGDPTSNWWWVPVAFQTDPYKLYYYYQLFSSIETKLLEQDHLNVLLVPRVTDSPEHE